MNGVSVLIKRDMIELVFLLRSLPCKNTARKWPSANQEGGLHHELEHAGTLLSDFQPPEL